jgi:hypothetical protein
MPYKPHTTAALVLELGTVYGCTMTAGSAAISSSGLSPSDVGRKVSVIGAGAATGDPYTAALLVSTVTSYSDGDYTLADAAITSVSPNDNLTVYRPLNTTADVLTRSPISYNKSLSTGKATLSFSVWSGDGSIQPQQGQPIWLHHDDLGDLFGGYIATIDQRNEPGTVGIETACSCVDWSGLLTQRLIGTYDSTYSSITLQALCEAIVYHHGGSEGFVVDSVTGPTILAAAYDYTSTVPDGLTDACGRASGPADSYWWYVDAWKVVHVVQQNTNMAPFSFRELDGSAHENWLAQIAVNVTGEKQANRVYANGKELGAQIAQTFLGDGSTQQFTLVNNAGLVVGIDVRTDLLTMGAAQTFAPKGAVDRTGAPIVAQWYWSIDGAAIEQDATGAPLTRMQGLHVDYQPSLPISAFYQYDAGVDAAAMVQGGTGYRDLKVDVPGIQPAGGIADIAQNIATMMSGLPVSIEAQTYRGGLDVAQLIPVELVLFHLALTDYLIDEVTLDCADNLMLWTVHMVSGPLIGDWRNAWINLIGGGAISVSTGGAAATVAGPPWDGLTYTTEIRNAGWLTANNIALSIPGDGLDGIRFWVVYVDELTSDCFVTSPEADGVTDPLSFTAVPNPDQVSALAFAVGDFVVWNDPAAGFEVNQITAITGTSWTVQRHYTGEYAGHSTFEAPLVAHTAGTKIMKCQVRQFLFNAALAGYDPSTGGVKRFDMVLPSVCVVAVVAAPYNQHTTGTWVNVNCASAAVPGLRTGLGNEFTLPVDWVTANPGVNVLTNDYMVRHPEPQRVNYAFCSTPVAVADLAINVVISSDGGATWNTVETLTISVGQTVSYPSVHPPKDQVTPYDGAWPFRPFLPGDRLNFTVEAGSANGLTIALDT